MTSVEVVIQEKEEEVHAYDLRTILVYNLHPNITEGLLYELFLQAGPVETVRIPLDKEGKKRNIAFVVFDHEESVPYSIALLEGIKLFRREIGINSRNPVRINLNALRAELGIPPVKSRFDKASRRVSAEKSALSRINKPVDSKLSSNTPPANDLMKVADIGPAVSKTTEKQMNNEQHVSDSVEEFMCVNTPAKMSGKVEKSSSSDNISVDSTTNSGNQQFDSGLGDSETCNDDSGVVSDSVEPSENVAFETPLCDHGAESIKSDSQDFVQSDTLFEKVTSEVLTPETETEQPSSVDSRGGDTEPGQSDSSDIDSKQSSVHTSLEAIVDEDVGKDKGNKRRNRGKKTSAAAPRFKQQQQAKVEPTSGQLRPAPNLLFNALASAGLTLAPQPGKSRGRGRPITGRRNAIPPPLEEFPPLVPLLEGEMGSAAPGTPVTWPPAPLASSTPPAQPDIIAEALSSLSLHSPTKTSTTGFPSVPDKPKRARAPKGPGVIGSPPGFPVLRPDQLRTEALGSSLLPAPAPWPSATETPSQLYKTFSAVTANEGASNQGPPVELTEATPPPPLTPRTTLSKTTTPQAAPSTLQTTPPTPQTTPSTTQATPLPPQPPQAVVAQPVTLTQIPPSFMPVSTWGPMPQITGFAHSMDPFPNQEQVETLTRGMADLNIKAEQECQYIPAPAFAAWPQLVRLPPAMAPAQPPTSAAPCFLPTSPPFDPAPTAPADPASPSADPQAADAPEATPTQPQAPQEELSKTPPQTELYQQCWVPPSAMPAYYTWAMPPQDPQNPQALPGLYWTQPMVYGHAWPPRPIQRSLPTAEEVNLLQQFGVPSSGVPDWASAQQMPAPMHTFMGQENVLRQFGSCEWLANQPGMVGTQLSPFPHCLEIQPASPPTTSTPECGGQAPPANEDRPSRPRYPRRPRQRPRLPEEALGGATPGKGGGDSQMRKRPLTAQGHAQLADEYEDTRTGFETPMSALSAAGGANRRRKWRGRGRGKSATRPGGDAGIAPDVPTAKTAM